MDNHGNISVYKPPFVRSASNVVKRNREVVVNVQIAVLKLASMQPTVGSRRIGKFWCRTRTALSTNLTGSHVHTDRTEWNRPCIGNCYEG